MCIILNVLNEPHMHVLASLFIYNDSFFSIPYLKNGTLTWSTFKLNRSRDKESSVLKVTEHKASSPCVWSWSSPAWQSAEKQPWFVATVRKCIFLLQKKHTTVAPWWPWVQAPTMNHNIPIRIWLRTFVACHPPPSLSLLFPVLSLDLEKECIDIPAAYGSSNVTHPLSCKLSNMYSSEALDVSEYQWLILSWDNN